MTRTDPRFLFFAVVSAEVLGLVGVWQFAEGSMWLGSGLVIMAGLIWVFCSAQHEPRKHSTQTESEADRLQRRRTTG